MTPRQFKATIAGIAAVALVILGMVSCSINREHVRARAITEMVQKGYTPIQARCAYEQGDSFGDATCMIATVNADTVR